MAAPDDRRRDLAELEAEFERVCAIAVEECRQLTPPYYPGDWVRMSRQMGAVRAAQRLVSSGDMHSGFLRLLRIPREDLTIEHAVREERWRPLFSDHDRENAAWRLRVGRQQVADEVGGARA